VTPGLLGVDAVLDPKNRSAAQSLILQIIEGNPGQRRGRLKNWPRVKKSRYLRSWLSLRTMRGQATDLGTNWFLTSQPKLCREYLEKFKR
jgi:hypothetical protein